MEGTARPTNMPRQSLPFSIHLRYNTPMDPILINHKGDDTYERTTDTGQGTPLSGVRQRQNLHIPRIRMHLIHLQYLQPRHPVGPEPGKCHSNPTPEKTKYRRPSNFGAPVRASYHHTGALTAITQSPHWAIASMLLFYVIKPDALRIEERKRADIQAAADSDPDTGRGEEHSGAQKTQYTTDDRRTTEADHTENRGRSPYHGPRPHLRKETHRID